MRDLKEVDEGIIENSSTKSLIYDVYRAIKDGIRGSVRVENLDEVKLPEYPSKVDIGAAPQIVQTIVASVQSIISAITESVGGVFRTENVGNRDATKPISVRLSNGKSFYNAMLAVSQGSGGGSSQDGIRIPRHNNGSLALNGATIEEYTFKMDLVTVGILTIVYTDSTKETISTWDIDYYNGG